MVDAPERIWANPTSRTPLPVKDGKKGNWLSGVWSTWGAHGAGNVEYVRADRLEALERENAELRVKIAELGAGLQFYANPKNWIDTPPWDGDPDCITPKAIPVSSEEGSVICDCGDRARAALAGSGSGGWRVPEGIPDPDLLAMSNGVISLHYEDLDKAQTAFDRIEALAAPAPEVQK